MNKKIGGYGIVIESWKEFPKSAFAVLTCTWHVREIREEKKLKGFQEGHWLFASRTLSKVDDDKNLDTRIMNHVKHHPCYNIFCIVTCTCLLRVATCYISIRSNDVPVLLLGLLFNFTNVIISKKKKKNQQEILYESLRFYIAKLLRTADETAAIIVCKVVVIMHLKKLKTCKMFSFSRNFSIFIEILSWNRCFRRQ